MSLILDALKKAEQDRHAGQPPVLDEMLIQRRAPSRQRQRPQQDVLVLAAIIASVLFALSGLVYWLWPSAQPAASQAVTAPAAPTAVASDEAPPAAPLRVDPERLESPLTETPDEALALAETEASEASTLDELDGESPRTSAPSAAAPPPAAASPPVEVAASPEPAPATPPPPPVVEAPAVRPLKDMPPAFRSDFPKLVVDVHVYDDNPLRRFALINGKKYRESDTLLDGPRLLEITGRGLIVEHRGSKVLIELPR